MENLKNVLNTKPDLQPEEVLAEVRHSVMESFSDGAEQYDDITMLCISRTNGIITNRKWTRNKFVTVLL
jgi:hypothetical protein